jgi:acyl-CoA thioesterase
VTSFFDEETSIEPNGDGSWRTELSAQWNIGDNPNGGYAASALLRSLSASVPHSAPLSVTSHFQRPALGDRAGTIEVEVVRAGRLTSTATGRLLQGDKERIRSIATFGQLDGDARTGTTVSFPPVSLPDPDACRSRDTLAQGIDLPIMSRLDVRLDPELAEPGVAGRAEMAGWIRFRDEAPVTAGALPLFCDAFPPSLFGLLGRVGWVPTLELTVHVRAIPVPGWIRARFETRDLAGGFLIEDGVLWDEAGSVVAQSRQLALLRTDGSDS